MVTAGIDIGSRSIELVVLKNGEIHHMSHAETSFDYINQVKELLSGIKAERIIATGYGRHLVAKELGFPHITEIKAHAAGIHRLAPTVRTILDIGGQDSKAISIDSKGRVRRFEMNDRCAAGTGRFLEVMAQALGCRISDFGELAMRGDDMVKISSMCTVFAETEVVALRARGTKPADVARALVNAVIQRSATMLKRVGIEGEVAFCGGVARNRAIVEGLSRVLNCSIIVPENPEFTGALGAALLAQLSPP